MPCWAPAEAEGLIHHWNAHNKHPDNLKRFFTSGFCSFANQKTGNYLNLAAVTVPPTTGWTGLVPQLSKTAFQGSSKKVIWCKNSDLNENIPLFLLPHNEISARQLQGRGRWIVSPDCERCQELLVARWNPFLLVLLCFQRFQSKVLGVFIALWVGNCRTTAAQNVTALKQLQPRRDFGVYTEMRRSKVKSYFLRMFVLKSSALFWSVK